MAVEYATNSTDEAPEMVDSETIEIPASIVGEAVVGPGDVIKLEVVGNDEDSEMITVKYHTPKQSKPEKGTGGIDEAVAEFEA